ncbi:hypothetical protein AAE02nite_41500 [Adhaeribacter aerolatus]|uniref:RagB/SusD family nutrient uptake outer membrane protein n=1 Tax=Adhaeribacter aerolatus TaxID=670289 RepID=A0A512B3E2_9BACT|nr:RagB/SusD family nutrient uptake outer membrane protein [Adhaeribacter aerolatus]GEO06486.1 hypothetical protein AAE02nite_41500 [Adhaeribacter aerolatus]
MKKNILYQLLTAGLLLTSTSCELTLEPYNGKSADTIFTTQDGIEAATLGNYANLKGNNYAKNLHVLTEYASDNVTLSGTTTNHLFFAYNYQHVVNMDRTREFWLAAYKVIYGTNAAIESIPEGKSPVTDQLLGENYFLRAMAHFDLVNLFGRPYSQDKGASAGVMIRKDTDVTALPPRSTVKEVYDFVIADLLKAAELMTVAKNSSFASKEVTYALLSRVYLYKEDNAKAIEYAEKVINSKRYKLMDTEPFKKYFTVANESNPETIFAIKHIATDDMAKAAIGSLYYSQNGAGWGEMYASETYRNLLNKNPNDARQSFVEPVYIRNAQGNITYDAQGKPVLEKRNGLEKYYINKYSWQEGLQTLSSPVYLRLADIYLMRAEANAKLGKNQLALDDVNLIRKRAGLSGDALYTLGDLKGHPSVLSVVLEERRLELAFEGWRKYDLFRNNMPLVRNYPGYHLLSGQNVQIVEPNSPRVVYFVPQNELLTNPNLTQNP